MFCFIGFLHVEPKHFFLLLKKTPHHCSQLSLSWAVLLIWPKHPISYLISSENNLLDFPRNLLPCILSSKILVRKSLYLIKDQLMVFFFIIELSIFSLKVLLEMYYVFFSILLVLVHVIVASNRFRSYFPIVQVSQTLTKIFHTYMSIKIFLDVTIRFLFALFFSNTYSTCAILLLIPFIIVSYDTTRVTEFVYSVSIGLILVLIIAFQSAFP